MTVSKYLEESCPTATLSNMDLTWTGLVLDLDLDLDLYCKRPATECPSHGTNHIYGTELNGVNSECSLQQWIYECVWSEQWAPFHSFFVSSACKCHFQLYHFHFQRSLMCVESHIMYTECQVCSWIMFEVIVIWKYKVVIKFDLMDYRFWHNVTSAAHGSVWLMKWTSKRC
jgi:hypothetical protein